MSDKKRKKFPIAKGPRVKELSSDIQTGSTSSDGPVKPREPNTTVTVKTVKGKENKAEQTMSTQQMMEELRAEMKQMLLTILEANSHCGETKTERLCKSVEVREWVKLVHTVSSAGKRAQEGLFFRGCRLQGRLSGNRLGLQGRDHQ